MMQDNKNYLFVKCFTAKEEPRRLQCGVYLAKEFPQYKKISTQNKINFIDGILTDMSECLVYGLYVLFNSTIYDKYYRILNGSTQVNSTEINAMPVPDLCCYVVLAMAGIKPDTPRSQTTNEWIGIHDIIQFVNKFYKVNYAENSRETFRKQALHRFRTAAWETTLERFLLVHEKLVDIYASKKKMTMMPVNVVSNFI